MRLLTIIRLIRVTQMLTLAQTGLLYKTMHFLWPAGKSGQWLVKPVTFRSSVREYVKFSVQRNMISIPDELFREWPQHLSSSRYLFPSPPTVPSLPARGICSKSLAHEEMEAPRFNWQAPCELSQQAVRQISSIIEPAKQQGQTRCRAWGDVAHKNTDRNFVRERPYFRGYRWKLQCYSPKAQESWYDRVFSDGKMRK